MKVLKMRKGTYPVFSDIGDLRKWRDEHNLERFVEGILRSRGEMPLSQFVNDYEFCEKDILDTATRLPSVSVVEV